MNLKQIRTEMGLSQREFAEKISHTPAKVTVTRKITAGRVSDYENGKPMTQEVRAIIDKIYKKYQEEELKRRLKKI